MSLHVNSDEVLWQGMLRGDADMFMSLYKKHYHALLFAGLKEIRDAQLIKDTIQQLFLHLWDRRETIHEARNVRSYLITSFRRKLSDDWKKSGRVSNLQVVHSQYTEDTAPTPEERLIRKDEQVQRSKILMEHIHDLPARQQELIHLRFYEGLNYDEIVQQTGLSPRTVYNKIHEALKRLRIDLSADKSSKNASHLLLLGAFILSCLLL